MGNVVGACGGTGSRSRLVGKAMCGLSVKRAVRVGKPTLCFFFCRVKRRGRALLDEGRTVLPSSDPTFALIVITPPGFFGMDRSGS